MSLAFVKEASKVDVNSGMIVVESDSEAGNLAIEELKSAEARNLAIQEAARMGLPSPGVSGNVSVVPVDEQGDPIEDPRTQRWWRWRAMVPVTRKVI